MHQGGFKVKNYNEWPTGQWYCSQQRSRAQYFLCIIAPHFLSTSCASNDRETSFQLCGSTIYLWWLFWDPRMTWVLNFASPIPNAVLCSRQAFSGPPHMLWKFLSPLTVAREPQNRKCWTDKLQERPHFIRSIRKWTEASTSVPCGQLLLGLIWKVIGIDFEFVELFRVT